MAQVGDGPDASELEHEEPSADSSSQGWAAKLVGGKPTLGQELTRLAERHARSYLPTFRWAQLLTPIVRRTRALSNHHARFRRLPVDTLAVQIGSGDDQLSPPKWPQGQPVTGRTRDQLKQMHGPSVDAIRVYEDERSQEVTARFDADAVAVGADVHVRPGKHRPEDPKRFALLAHEAYHVVEFMRSGAAWRRATMGGQSAEEAQALMVEGHALESALQPIAPLSPKPPTQRTPGATSTSSPATQPMAAPVNREIPTPPPELPDRSLDVENLRESIYQDIVARIRTDMERGG